MDSASDGTQVRNRMTLNVSRTEILSGELTEGSVGELLMCAYGQFRSATSPRKQMAVLNVTLKHERSELGTVLKQGVNV